jgi:hypothetical protein
VNGVIQEIQNRVAACPLLEGKTIDALYFGGVTANLTPAEPFRRLCRKLNELFDLRQAEATPEKHSQSHYGATMLKLAVVDEKLHYPWGETTTVCKLLTLADMLAAPRCYAITPARLLPQAQLNAWELCAGKRTIEPGVFKPNSN